MNNSQLLYKISNLRYNIRMKTAEYVSALKENVANNVDETKAALTLLNKELSQTLKELELYTTDKPAEKIEEKTKIRKWQPFFNFKISANKK